jgi:two-component system CheB/CheR fusion protein
MKRTTATHKTKDTAQSENENIPSPGFPIVGIGASAGGLEALGQFFEHIPNDNGMAFVVIQHLAPNHVGVMPELLQRTTKMKVVQASDRLKVLPNHVYVIPPNKSMSILKGYLFLFEPVEMKGLRLPIDLFFRSLAEDQQKDSVGIILSGMGSDGSLGLKAIKEKNGIAMVQEPLSAKFDGMPNSAINATIIDITAPAGELFSRLVTFLKHSAGMALKPEIDNKSKTNLEKIIILLRTHTGHDFSLYKKSTLFRRIERRMSVHQIDKIANYIRFLQENPAELDILFKELLIGVTNFFRDTLVWDKMKNEILPGLFNEMPNGQVIRAWIIGCSTGEEAYSLAIVFKEAVEKLKNDKKISLQIFATDIDVDAIDIARKGIFSSNILADVSPERINQYFTKDGNVYHVNSNIREMILFAPHNVIKDPPFTKIDILTCRNLLIYMETELQKKMMNLFHYSLNTGGVMLLGSSENENSKHMLFSPIDSKLKIYKRSSVSPGNNLLSFPSSFSNERLKPTEDIKPKNTEGNIQSLADQLILKHYAPASVLVNQEGDILYITGRTGTYLEPAAGKANMNIYAMAREGLRNELPGAIRKAIQNYEPVKLKNIEVGTNGGTQVVNVTFQRIEKPTSIEGLIIIVFADVEKLSGTKGKKLTRGNHDSKFDRQELELELQLTKEEMQTTQEELKMTNEELQSANEELQSANEELTTSKEEMQSLNEELQTINAEQQSKISDYVSANNDMKNLLNSTDIATLFLDKELNIRRYTEQLTKLFKLRQTDIGRPFTDMVTDLNYPEMAEHAEKVLNTLVFKETAVSTRDGRWFTVRIMPYRTFDDRIDGLVITLIEITKAKKMEAELEKANELLREHNLLPDS